VIARLAKLPAHARTVAALLLTALVLIFVVSILELGGWFWQSHQRIGELEPRIARLLGYEQSTEQLRASEEQVQRQFEGLVFPAESDSGSVGAAVQQDVQRVLEGAGMSVINREVVGRAVQDTLEVIRVRISATGNMEALDQGLVDLGNSRPLLVIESLEITPLNNARRGDVRQEVSATLSLRVVKLL